MSVLRKVKTKANTQLPLLHPHAAGIDSGATQIQVAVPCDADPKPVRTFTTFTDDLLKLRDWLKDAGVRTVAMESTGVYWIALFQVLAAAGLEVCLVNARHCKNLPGRKTDISDCQWLQYLHSVGLLRASFRPPEAVCAVRSLLRHRGPAHPGQPRPDRAQLAGRLAGRTLVYPAPGVGDVAALAAAARGV